jgi:hypothetical protein
MTVSMGIRHRDTGEYEYVPIATSETFRCVWLPACQQLGLGLVALFDGGALTSVPAELVPRIIEEVERLRDWVAAQPGCGFVAERCTDILKALERTDPTVCDYDFG